MSTFNGIVAEFPDVRIDRFRQEPSARPALAYFLSHIHTDHLVGIETVRSPFIYCSSATRNLLLQLESYPDRMNFANGITEKRMKRYEHLKRILRPIPLETPTKISLGYNHSVTVTLFEANHCTGAVMFLLQDRSHAILYTGDIRSEDWWIDSLLRHPLLLPYVAKCGQKPLRHLDNIYLDTTFASKKPSCRKFPTKADGLAELLRKVARYSKETLFYFDTWTYGYEEVWYALSNFLGSRIHLDNYRYDVYKALKGGDEKPRSEVEPEAPWVPEASEASKLIGCYIGHDYQHGCLSANAEECRIHSCESGTGCGIWSKPFVRITPMVCRMGDGRIIAEAGADGGYGDLNQEPVKLLKLDDAAHGMLTRLCRSELKDQPQLRDSVRDQLDAVADDPTAFITVDVTALEHDLVCHPGSPSDGTQTVGGMPATSAIRVLPKQVAGEQHKASAEKQDLFATPTTAPKEIMFPYSRHSSYNELCELIRAFKPKDIYPCSVNEQGWESSKHSMKALFGHIYKGSVPDFTHDRTMTSKQVNKSAGEGSESGVISQTPPQDTQERESGRSAHSLCNNHDKPSRPSSNRRGSLFQGNVDVETERHSSKRRKVFTEPDDRRPSKLELDQRPALVDHYSPPDRRVLVDHFSPQPRVAPAENSGYSTSGTSSSVEKERSAPSAIEGEFVAQSRQPKRSSNKQIPVSSGQLVDNSLSRVARSRRKSKDYGRLSPPNPMALEGEGAELDERELKNAWQVEAYNAALGRNGMTWSDVGLSSVSGQYQDEETEL